MIDRIHLAEVYRLESFDGKAIHFNREIFLTGNAGFGSPPIEYETRTGYKQDGETLIDKRLQPVNLSLSIRGETQNNRAAFWDLRARILDVIRPNRGGALRLYVVRPDDSKRAIDCHYVSGLTYDQSDISDFGVDAQITLRAFTPLWINPVRTLLSPASGSSGNLVFPITFPITFGTSGLRFSTGDIDYQGTWKTYPQITVTGPYNTCKIMTNASNGVIDLFTSIDPGEQRIIDLNPDNLSIVDENGDSKFDEILKSTNLVDFAIFPEGEFDSTITQTISAVLSGGTESQSAFTVGYYEKYFGI